MNDVLAVVCAAVWIYLICARGRFWACSVRDEEHLEPLENWPSVAVVVPARDEANVIVPGIRSLLEQGYPGMLSIVVVDDDSCDGTGSIASSLIGAGRHPLTVLRGRRLPAGWTGKLWALSQGIAVAKAAQPDYLLLTDADIVHAPDTVSWLVKHSSAGGFVLTSLMARLRCVSFAERSHVPAFVYFFQMLFPFQWVCRRDTGTAAGAGGCMLVRTDALQRAGGVEAIRNALIDDCALAARLKAVGPIWLGLTDRVRSIRSYETFDDVRAMISRSAYAQLRHSPILLIATVAGMLAAFLAPVWLAVFASGLPQYAGVAMWIAMAVSFQPILRFYQLPPWWGLALPAIALVYMFYTLDSTVRHILRRGGQWKGRIHVDAPGWP